MSHRRWLALFGLMAIAAIIAGCASPPVPLTLERIHADPPLEGRTPRSLAISPGGRFVSYLQPSAQDSDVLELWLRPLPAGEPRRLASASDLIGQREVSLTEAEKSALERRRMFRGGITSYAWCGDHDERVIVPLSGALYVIEIAKEPPRVRRLGGDDADPPRDPRCDRAGGQVAFVQHNDLWVRRIDAGESRRLTHTGSDTLTNGLADFIAAEEFDRFDGFWWSRDGLHVLAFEADDSHVPIKSRMQIRARASDVTQQRYPAAGDPNAVVRALVIDVADGSQRSLAVPAEAEYTVRAGWFDDGTPWLEWMTRDQKQLHLVEYPVASAPAELRVEREDTWVDVRDDLMELPRWPLSGRPSLLWSSENSGRRQLWQIDRVTHEARLLTHMPEPVEYAVCAGTQGVVFAGLQEQGMSLGLHLLASDGQVSVLDGDAQHRWLSAKADTDCQRLLVTQSTWTEPPRTSVRSIDGGAPPIEIVGSDPDPLLAAIVPRMRVLDFKAADGVTPLHAIYMPPLAPSSHPAGHAMIVSAYGGPAFSEVAWRWSAGAPLYAYWQRLGFAVMLVENRGMSGHDRDFTHAHYRRFGAVEVDDLFAVLHQLPGLVGEVDPARVGLVGWSYGGYLAARAVLDTATPFAAAVAGAPVTDWTLYDTGYTERYLGLPSVDLQAYRDADLTLRAAQLSRPLMLIHGTADDNVLFEHSLRLMQALQAEGKLFETVIYPGQTHGLGGKTLQLHEDRSTTDFFLRRLRP